MAVPLFMRDLVYWRCVAWFVMTKDVWSLKCGSLADMRRFLGLMNCWETLGYEGGKAALVCAAKDWRYFALDVKSRFEPAIVVK